MKLLSEMTKEERSLLLYLEVCLVDGRGRVNQRKINNIDRSIIEIWNDEKFVKTGRVCIDEYIESMGSTWVEFSTRAWQLAHLERKNRANRSLEKRQWLKTSEKTEEI